MLAIDRATGQEVWRASWPGAMSVPFFAAANGSWIRATPALHDGRLYVAGMKDVLVCLEAATGAIHKYDDNVVIGDSMSMSSNTAQDVVLP